MNTFFDKNDIELLKQKQIEHDLVLSQIALFKKSIPFIHLLEPATIKNGIKQFNAEEIEEKIVFFENNVRQLNLLKFVPASGAASRMFKDFFSLREDFLYQSKDNDLLNKNINSFFEKLSKYPFYDSLRKIMTKVGEDFEEAISTKNFLKISQYILFEEGLNFAQTPKALIEFHNYLGFTRTAIEEHLVEGALYTRDTNNRVKLHFTISPEHKERITQLIDRVKLNYEKLLGVTFNISYSIQKPSTDTIAVDKDNKPFRDIDGKLVFRPGGHGALIENLNDCSEDLIFIKNIDNVVPDRLKNETVKYKKVLAAFLIQLKQKVHECLAILDRKYLPESELMSILKTAKDEFDIHINVSKLNPEELQETLFNRLNRPIRVCGMVINEGEPGGGPFLILNPLTNEASLQIIESSQIDMNNQEQSNIAKQATHFNPVDIVCWTKNYKGQKFNLKDFVNPDTAFISTKSKDGKELKALELPGLWNGAMADWITLFVEVPLVTFNPVKTVDDLIRTEHKAVL
ncbi:MAG: DUF4301 family protein [Bacteroidales bacterium]|nr:DUF4301 family protein [Bacteroidales bacterium]